MAMAFYQLGVMAIEDLFLTQVCTNLCHTINLCLTSSTYVSHHQLMCHPGLHKSLSHHQPMCHISI